MKQTSFGPPASVTLDVYVAEECGADTRRKLGVSECVAGTRGEKRCHPGVPKKQVPKKNPSESVQIKKTNAVQEVSGCLQKKKIPFRQSEGSEKKKKSFLESPVAVLGSLGAPGV